MSNAQARRMVLRSLAAVVLFGQAQAATPALTPGGVAVPHFGKAKPRTCVPLVRQRIKAVMNDKSAARFEAQPPASNRPCK